MYMYDAVRGKGFKYGHILRLDILGYEDDVGLISDVVNDMTKRVTKITDDTKNDTDMDMNVSLSKTKNLTHHVPGHLNSLSPFENQIHCSLGARRLVIFLS